MKKIIILFLAVFFTSDVLAQPLPVKIKHTIIIDTDCAIDDMRAISLLLARPEITIKAILSSDGSLSPNEGAEKISSLLYEFNYDEIPVACGDVLEGINPPWREFNKQISWGGETISHISSMQMKK
jgi:pyrimidine-specific ribonucleoside hydrolase